MGAPWDVPPEEWHRLLDVNLLGVVNGLRSFVPRLLDSGRSSRLLVTASLAGLVTFPGGGAYSATKHAVAAVAQQAALALADTPISVTLLCPALVRTGMSEIGEEPAEVAKVALEACAAGRFLVVPPEWSDSVVSGAERLVSGVQPRVPTHGRKRVRQLRLVVEAEDYEAALRFYRDRLGLTEELQIHSEEGEYVTILQAGRATLELSNPAQVELIDRVEVGRHVSPHMRAAFEVEDAAKATDDLVEGGGRLVAPPTRTPWNSLNARLEGPAGLQLTLFEERDST